VFRGSATDGDQRAIGIKLIAKIWVITINHGSKYSRSSFQCQGFSILGRSPFEINAVFITANDYITPDDVTNGNVEYAKENESSECHCKVFPFEGWERTRLRI
jgi:hypothetical protein